VARDITSLISGLNVALDKDVLTGTTPLTKKRIRAIIHACGWKQRSPQRLDELESRLGDAGLFANPDITDMDLGLNTWIRFTREPATPVGKILKPERALGYHLSKYPAELERVLPDLKKLRHRHGGRKPEKTYGFEGMSLRPDLVFSSSSGKWLTCELERGDPKKESVDQLELYMRAVSKPNRDVVGVLVTGTPRTKGVANQTARRIEDLRRRDFDARWIVYDVAVRLESM